MASASSQRLVPHPSAPFAGCVSQRQEEERCRQAQELQHQVRPERGEETAGLCQGLSSGHAAPVSRHHEVERTLCRGAHDEGGIGSPWARLSPGTVKAASSVPAGRSCRVKTPADTTA